VLPERVVDIEELEDGVGLVEASFSSTAVATAPPSAATTSTTNSPTMPSSSSFKLPNLHLRVAQGEIVGIYGKIGAGKRRAMILL